jgi:two-component system NtrC family sensor kinase
MKRRVRGANGTPSPSRARADVSTARRATAHAPNGAATKKRRPVPSVPADWLSELLQVACRLPTEKGPEQVAASLLESVSALVPSHAFGVTIGPPGKRPRLVRAARAGEKVAVGSAGDRLFPRLRHERALPVKHEHEAIRLYVAGDDPAELADGSALFLFLERVAEVLASALHTTRLVAAHGLESLELREQVIQSAKLANLGQMAAGVVHELTNPLTSIVGYSDYLRAKAERDRADPDDVERLRRIGESAGRILRFSRDLMAYARPSIEPPSPVAIHSVIDQALVFCEHVLGSANVRVERRFAPGLLPVLGVRDQLTQVFVNLFTNACHAMEPSGGTLTVETAADGPRRTVRSVVGDTGHGIDKQNLGRIFEPFFTTKTDGRGTGLGLSIVRNIVLLHGGTVSVDSRRERGTTFIVELPISQ